LACTTLYVAEMLCAGGFHFHLHDSPEHAGAHPCQGCKKVHQPLPLDAASVQLAGERSRGHHHDSDSCPACQYLAQSVTPATPAGMTMRAMACGRIALPDLTELPRGTLFVPHSRGPPA
jgi:hypothetical protein